MRAVVVGAGLGGLATALRLQGMGADVTVVEQRPRPGGRAYQLRDGGFTWDTGPSLLTMPWVLEETFAAGGLDLHAELTLRRLDPLYRIHWAGEERHFDFAADPARLRAEVARFSARDAAQVEPFLAALRADLRAGDPRRRAARVRRARATSPGSCPTWSGSTRCGRCTPSSRAASSTRGCARRSPSTRCSSAATRTACPRSTARSCTCRCSTAAGTPTAGCTAWSRRWPAPLDVRCGEPVERIEHAGGRVTGVRLAGGERIAADVVVSNADVLRTHELVGRPRRGGGCARRCPASCSTSARTGRSTRLRHHTLLVGDGYREFIRAVTRGRELPRTFSTYVHAPARTEPAMAPAGGDSLAILLPVPNLRAGIDWDRDGDRLRDALVADLETSFGLHGLGDAVVVEHRMTPLDFARDLGAVWGNAFAVEPTLHQSAYFRQPNRDRRRRRALPRRRRDASGRRRARRAARRGGHGGADRARPRAAARARGSGGERVVTRAPRPARPLRRPEARATTNRVARTFSLACRLLPRPVRDDVYLLYLVFRTLDDLVDDGGPTRPSASRRSTAWAAGRRRASARARCAVLDELAARHPLPRAALADFCEGMRWDLAGRAFATEAELDAYCYRVAGTVGIVMASRARDDRRRARAARRRGARDGDAADEHPARPRRGRRRGPLLPRARDDRPLRRAGAGRARGAAARPDREGGRALRRGTRRGRAAARGPGRGPRGRAGCTARSCARSSATATAPAPGGRRWGAAASSGWCCGVSPFLSGERHPGSFADVRG